MLFSISGTEAGIVNTMPVDALMPCVARSSAAMVLMISVELVHVSMRTDPTTLHYNLWKMIENDKYIFTSLQANNV